MNKKNLICFLLLVIVIGVYYNYQKGDEAISQSAKNTSDKPIYQSDDMLTDIYDLSGELVYKIESSNVRYFDDAGKTAFDLPNLTLYDQNHVATWHIKAKKAELTNDKLLYLYTDVQLDNLTQEAQLKQVKTDNAVVDLTSQIVTSKDPVIINGVGFYSTGVGLAGDLHAKTANILENVKTYYNTEAK
ncbi:LPS export ABC transporter periplasmic protein LptC [Gilliamella sp. Fer1-1]|jgi:lipopolysaccharide export system protein LptC|uniref:LPS export ABC transporter periplasmic protein LptC n=1 Tax=unclassified Gilliamella TaxID=2685620 RepID=UPI00080DD228|nr:LPS export ABC transporter periplasmic protein LptC [Gilliamella apicola]OCG25824.1 LPS export ABC transporter periplasmic protein LptC [Gilliamella apicola]OCG28945.1 LPS export ABC transporter periplasmic protein LptC [Gilliamella apicola]OCG33573.1 LPS export ABC transporter periplasmic protein LptC [Gilliamella apicola]OCG39006.1 LPS export ABC transporter periplasmic protein LptC [Gilliamella apicola]OCG74138.1 LPS export ABC transporter periplasmic protein LptC [Gilliamella apicola]